MIGSLSVYMDSILASRRDLTEINSVAGVREVEEGVVFKDAHTFVYFRADYGGHTDLYCRAQLVQRNDQRWQISEQKAGILFHPNCYSEPEGYWPS